MDRYSRIVPSHNICIDGKPVSMPIPSLWSATDTNPRCWSVPFENLPREVLFDSVSASSARFQSLVSDIVEQNPQKLAETFSYHSTKGKPFTRVLGPILLHVYNHGTHHRGQISAALTALGHKAPVLDLLYFLDQNS